MRRSGEDERWREGAADRKLRKKEQKEWLDSTLPDPNPCTAGNKSTIYTAMTMLNLTTKRLNVSLGIYLFML